MARILPGSILHLNAARAAGGTGAGSNTVPTSEFYDLSGNGNHGTLTNFGYEAGDRPRTNVETDKALWHDQSGLGNDGTLTGFGFTEASGWATTPDRLVFDGTDYVVLPDLSAAEGAFTYEALCRHTVSASALRMVSEGDSAGAAYAELRAHYANARFAVGNDAAGAVGVNSVSTINTGSDVHAVGTYDLSDLRVYIDGLLDITPTAGPGGTVTLNVATLGRQSDVAAGFYQGGLLVARVYTRCLSAAEIAWNYEQGATGTDYVRDGLVLDFNAARAVRPSGWVEL